MDKQYRLQTVERIAELLDYLVSAPDGATLTELSLHLGRSKTTIYRLLVNLVRHGYVTSTDYKRYRVGPTLWRLGLAAVQKLDVRRVALPYLLELNRLTAETVNLSIRVGDERVYIESIESPQEIRQRVELGRPMSLLLGASSKAILAFLQPEELNQLLSKAVNLCTATGRNITPDQLHKDLEAIRQRGYAISVSERLSGAFSVAGPIFDHRGQVIASVSVSGPIQRWRQELEASLGPLVLQAASNISRELGCLRLPAPLAGAAQPDKSFGTPAARFGISPNPRLNTNAPINLSTGGAQE